MEAVLSPETLLSPDTSVTFCQNARRHIPEYRTLGPEQRQKQQLLSLNDQQKISSSCTPLRRHTGCVVIRQVGRSSAVRHGETAKAVGTTASESSPQLLGGSSVPSLIVMERISSPIQNTHLSDRGVNATRKCICSNRKCYP
jgi:hypothetical protein